MSMNLIFDIKDVKDNRLPGHVDFPFQTPTDLTYDVLNAETIEGKLDLIKKVMVSWKWDENHISNTLSEIESLLKCKHLELSMI